MSALAFSLFVSVVAAQPRPLLVVVPLGSPSEALVEDVAQAVRDRLEVRVLVAANAKLPQAAWYAPRKRWRAEKILDYLDAQDFPRARWVAAITEEPISTTKGKVYDWGIAGLGSLGGKSSVLTAHLFRRYRKRDPRKYRRYMENLVLHEVGHTLGLSHCPSEKCIMADAKGNAIRAARRSDNRYCERCRRLAPPNLINERSNAAASRRSSGRSDARGG